MDGVVRVPSAFSMTFGAVPSITATQELVVPRSIPMTFAIFISSFRQTGLVRPFEKRPYAPFPSAEWPNFKAIGGYIGTRLRPRKRHGGQIFRQI